MTIDTPEQLDRLRKIGRIVSETLAYMGTQVRPGITTGELDALGREKLEALGARSAPQLLYNFPGATCISVNHEVAHGIPGDRVIEPGDLVNIDVSAELDGFFADSGYTFMVPPVTPEKQKLCEATQRALKQAIAAVRAGEPLNVIGKEIQKVARKSGHSVIMNLGSHGVGNALHEEPFFIPPFYDETDTRLLHDGMVITIEPFLSTGAWKAEEADDGWTLKTEPGIFTAQYEHTLVVTRGRAIILT